MRLNRLKFWWHVWDWTILKLPLPDTYTDAIMNSVWAFHSHEVKSSSAVSNLIKFIQSELDWDEQSELCLKMHGVTHTRPRFWQIHCWPKFSWDEQYLSFASLCWGFSSIPEFSPWKRLQRWSSGWNFRGNIYIVAFLRFGGGITQSLIHDLLMDRCH